MAKKKQTFEEDLKELERIVDLLEGGDLQLEESLTCFEEGVACAARCRKTLQDAEFKVERLLKDRGGNLTTEPLDEQ